MSRRRASRRVSLVQAVLFPGAHRVPVVARLGVGLVLDVDGGFLGPGGPAVDPHIARDQVGLGVRMRSLVLGDQAGPGFGVVTGQRGVLGKIPSV